MQFVTNGPDIPNELLHSHEDGNVVFFCGAGISYPAGLEGFKWLVDETYSSANTTPTDIEQKAYERKRFDVMLDLLEDRLPGQRIAVRRAVAKVLKPDLSLEGATDTHEALLQLARNRKGELRLVTTNFDRIFNEAAKRIKQKFTDFAASMLPVPKRSRWDGLVYLHGLLPDKQDAVALNQLVLTSGDFGLAYLVERWAARFVSELFRNFRVCFVGYSIDDPILRYIMDAFAADRRQGESTPQAFAFGDYTSGKEEDKIKEWQAKGVAPILYEVPSGSKDHSLLHITLKKWADSYRDGISGKEHIVFAHARTHPSESTQQEDFVGRVLWALSDKSGLPAKRFADLDPVPPLEWLKFLSHEHYQQSDLHHFDVSTHSEVDEKLRFSLLRRPAPYTHAPRMSLVHTDADHGKLDDAMFHLARWLVRHLNDPELILWLVQRGNRLHNSLRSQIENKLDELASLEREGKTAELGKIRENAPNAIPDHWMKMLWRLLLTGRVKSSWDNSRIYSWKNQLVRNGLTATLRLELRKLLAPKVAFGKPLRRRFSDDENEKPKRLSDLVYWELELATDYAKSSLSDLNDERWQETLPKLLDDFQQLLCDALDLFFELGTANERSDHSHWDLPSISPHWQNRGFNDWVVLIELLRDAWLAIRESDPERAKCIARDWFDLPYPTFKRLALFAASHDDCITPDKWVSWLINENAWWLWSVDTQRETMRLLVLQGAKLLPRERYKLEMAILGGPPREMFKEDLEHERWQSIADDSVWLHLAKLKESGRTLGQLALQRFTELSKANPDWKLASNERDEFPQWMSGTGDPGFEEDRVIDIAPRRRKQIVKWLKQKHPKQHPLYEDTWREVCRTRFYHCIYALCDLSSEKLWPVKRWEEALFAWSDEDQVQRSWKFASTLVQKMPDEILQKAAYSVSFWLKAASRSIGLHEEVFFDLCKRFLKLEYKDEINNNEPVTDAINHPIGHVTEALINLWFKRKPSDNDKLPDDIEPLFTRLCDTSNKPFRHGRVMLASQLIPLFRVDRPWTEERLLPLFDWKNCPIEAQAFWTGFLRSPRLYRPLLVAFKTQFLETAGHHEELGKHSGQFDAFLTYVALDGIDESYTVQDFRTAFEKLPQEGLLEAAKTLLRALESTGEQREIYWKTRIKPFWRKIWPKSLNLITDNIADSLARMSIAACSEFPDALETVQDWLRPIEYSGYVINLLHKSGRPEHFPEEALSFLDLIIGNQSQVPREFVECLETIREAKPELADDSRFLRLKEHARRQGF